VYGADVQNFTYSSYLQQHIRGELSRCMGSSWLLKFCHDDKWIPTISREQSLYFVVHQISHSLDTKRIVLFVAALIQGVPWVLFRFRISSWPDLYRKSPSQCSTACSSYACKSVRHNFIIILYISHPLCCSCYSDVKVKHPLQAWGGPEGSRKLRFPDYMTTAQDGGKVVSLTHRPPLPPRNTPGTHFC
jgi:hypothetical protein